MKLKIDTKVTILFLAVFYAMAGKSFSQVENIPLSDPVYVYLKQMSVKQIIPSIGDDDPNLSRGQVQDYLLQIEERKNELSHTERDFLYKYKSEFFLDEIDNENTTMLFGGKEKFGKRLEDVFSDKNKYLYIYNKNDNYAIVEAIGTATYSNGFKPNNKSDAVLMDIGFRISGTLFEHLGYNFAVTKGGVFGNDANLAAIVDPRLNYNFKFIENSSSENVRSYDFVEGYLKYFVEPMEDMEISVQIGREKEKLGFGYDDRLVLSGNHPDLDFIKLNFSYGVFNFSSLQGSTVGQYSNVREDNYTKFLAMNRLTLSFDELFDIGIGETVIYSRGIDLGYLNPFIFYKFVEHSLQDRDNGTIFFDFQSNFIKDFQVQAMFFMDENILSNLTDFDKQSNKTAYQVGAMWYEPFKARDLTLILQYTKIRPYVYTHNNPKNTYTSFGQILGSGIGPNADRLYSKASYNFNDWITLNLEYSKERKGENILDANGGLVRNVGGDVFQNFRQGTDSGVAFFLDGVRVNTDIATVNLSIEPIRDFVFDINYVYRKDRNITNNISNDLSYGFIKMTMDY